MHNVSTIQIKIFKLIIVVHTAGPAFVDIALLWCKFANTFAVNQITKTH